MNWGLIKLSACVGVGLLLYYVKKRCGGRTCRCLSRLDGKVAVVTGGTSGIGLAVAEELAKRGATVIFTARNLDKGIAIQEQIRHQAQNPKVYCKQLDLNDSTSIRQFVVEVNEFCKTIHLLINNAGVFYHPPQETVDHFDVTLQTNYLGPFLLTELLIEKLVPSSRLIFVTSASQSWVKSLDVKLHRFSEEAISRRSDRILGYAETKLRLLLYSNHLALRLREKGISVYSVDPGHVETPMYRHFPYLQNPILKLIQKPIRYIVIKSPIQGAQTVLHCALSPNLEQETGLYYCDLESVPLSGLSLNAELAADLYRESSRWAENINNQITPAL